MTAECCRNEGAMLRYERSLHGRTRVVQDSRTETDEKAARILTDRLKGLPFSDVVAYVDEVLAREMEQPHDVAGAGPVPVQLVRLTGRSTLTTLPLEPL